ncbi:MAG: hypothetical protein V4707_10210 [Pseudomonadota bacterium]
MRRSISTLLAAATVLAGAPALAQQAPAAPRAVYVCAADSATARSFQQRHGVRPIFVTAREVRAAAAAGERWNAPRCMTEREHRRWAEASAERASVR